jgi:hypothetical protein
MKTPHYQMKAALQFDNRDVRRPAKARVASSAPSPSPSTTSAASATSTTAAAHARSFPWSELPCAYQDNSLGGVSLSDGKRACVRATHAVRYSSLARTKATTCWLAHDCTISESPRAFRVPNKSSSSSSSSFYPSSYLGHVPRAKHALGFWVRDSGVNLPNTRRFLAQGGGKKRETKATRQEKEDAPAPGAQPSTFNQP